LFIPKPAVAELIGKFFFIIFKLRIDKLEMKNNLNYDNNLVKKVSDFLQTYMRINNLTTMTADECADTLHNNLILSNEGHPKSGFNFRQLLRDGRDKKIDLVLGAFQERPRTKWFINRITKK
jgi:hypothetical protein